MRYPRIADGDFVRVTLGKYGKKHDGVIDIEGDSISFACCDCGMVHQFIPVRLTKSDIALHIIRKDRSTGQLRRHRFGKLHKGVGKWRLIKKCLKPLAAEKKPVVPFAPRRFPVEST